MAIVEVVIRLTDIKADVDIESVQDKISDILYKAGYSHIEPVGVTLYEEDKPCTCG
jgi:translation elongation factor EF-1beta